MKVSELANELGTTSKEILEIIKKNDPSAKLFAATKLTEAQENAVRGSLSAKNPLRLVRKPVRKERRLRQKQRKRAARLLSQRQQSRKTKSQRRERRMGRHLRRS